MKLVEPGELDYGRIKSEGKILEAIPVLTDASGQPYILPPVFWHVENWVLGYLDYHTLGGPETIWYRERWVIPGSSARNPVSLSFIVRVLEDGAAPEGAQPGHIDATAVKELISAIREDQNREDQNR